MLKMMKYMKGYVKYILLIVVLLFCQAYCDLELPSYTSNIVDIGIQQNGIEDAVFEKVSKQTASALMQFMTEDEKNQFEKDYTLKDDVYELNKISSKEHDSLNEALNKNVMYTSLYLMQASESDQKKSSSDKVEISLDSKEVKQAMQMLMAMPKEQIDQMKSKLDEGIAKIPDMMKDQYPVYFVKAEYQSLGLDLEKIQQTYILIAGAKMLAMALLIVLCGITVTFLSSRMGAGFSRDMRKRVYGKVMSFSNNEFNHFSTASLITRSTNDIQQIQMVLIMFFRMVLYAPILGIGGILKAVNTDVSMTWIIALAVVVILGFVGLLVKIAMPKFKSLQNKIDRINQISREILTGIQVIRAFTTQKHEEKRFDEGNKSLMKTNLFVNRCMSLMFPIMMLIMNVTTVAIVYFGARGIDDGAMQVGQMMAFIQYAMMIIMSFLMMSMLSVMIPRASVSAERIHEILDTDVSIKDPVKALPYEKKKDVTVSFSHVDFAYPGADEKVLSDIDFVAESGKTTAFIGSTGSGKSTLVNLIPRFYDVTNGEIKINGVNIKDYSLKELHQAIGYVPQKAILFSGTIESNILYGAKDQSMENAKEAASIAQATEFIDTKPEGYASPIAQGGSNVSGGQKQRLSIARAIAKNPDIYIFDDSFSALDYKTDYTLRKELEKKTHNAVTLIVAQRISTILHADQIIVLDEGKIVGKGTHRELLNNCPVYRQIAESQLSKEELANE